MSSLSKIDTIEKIIKSSSITCDDILLSNISAIVKQRKYIAIELQKCTDDGKYKILLEFYNEYNTMLCKLLAI
jgi:signal recognition particle receptor subunit beta